MLFAIKESERHSYIVGQLKSGTGIAQIHSIPISIYDQNFEISTAPETHF